MPAAAREMDHEQMETVVSRVEFDIPSIPGQPWKAAERFPFFVGLLNRGNTIQPEFVPLQAYGPAAHCRANHLVDNSGTGATTKHRVQYHREW